MTPTSPHAWDSQAKADLRRRYSELRQAIPPAERASAEAAIREGLFSLPAWQNAPLILGYMSIRGELDTTPIWARAVSEGKGYALPVTLTGTAKGEMLFRRTPGFAPEELIPARFGVSEPAEDCPALTLRELEGSLILIPGLVFDDRGYRLGYGGGYYDRFLSELRAAGVSFTTAGLVFHICRTDHIPHEAHDIPVDIILDERRILHPHGIHHPTDP
jgi:5-formyltetrahydrofolate cyclo-ligase